MEVALRVSSVSKTFGAVVAVEGASLELETCKIHAIVGENGAGKSTLSLIAAGLIEPSAGKVETFGGTVGMVQQHFRLIDALSVLDNAMLGAEPMRSFGRIDRDAARSKLAKVAEEIGATLPPNARTGQLGVGDRQRLEIARVLFRDARTITLDEPTAVLSPQEAASLYATLRKLADGGRAIAVVTHKLDEVLDHADSVTVMRRGRVVSTRAVDRAGDHDHQRRVLLHDAFHDSETTAMLIARGSDENEKMLLEIEGLKVGDGAKLHGVRLHVRAKEIVGVAGVEGNGQRELVEVLAGLREASGGTVRAHAPIEVVHDDRHRQGLVLGATVADNAELGELARFAHVYGLLDLAAMRSDAKKRVDAGGVVPAEIDLPASALSGGNQQKLVVARALARSSTAAHVLVVAQPTRGVDLAAARQIHERIAATASDGAGVLVISSDLDELRALCHRIVVLTRGRIVGDARRDAEGHWDDAATNEKLGARMASS